MTDKPLPCRFQTGDIVSFCRDKSVKEKHRLLVEVAGITFTDMGVYYDVWVLDGEGLPLGDSPLVSVDQSFLFQIQPDEVQ